MRPRSWCARSCCDQNRHLEGRALGDIAAERGSTPAQTLVDLAIEESLGTWFIRSDIGHVDPAAVGSMLAHPNVHIGASDAGAHVGSFATQGDTGLLMSKFVREAGALHPGAGREEDHCRHVCDLGAARPRSIASRASPPTSWCSIRATIDRGPEVASDDFPGGGTRWIRRSIGVDTVIVNGTVTWTKAVGYVAGARAGVIATR